jgi:hypothetical protein
MADIKNGSKKSAPQEIVIFRHLNFIDDPDGQFFAPVELARRPGFNTTGREVTLAVNTYPITQFPTKTVYQYDVRNSPFRPVQLLLCVE